MGYMINLIHWRFLGKRHVEKAIGNMRSRGKIFQGHAGCDWSAIRRSIKFGAVRSRQKRVHIPTAAPRSKRSKSRTIQLQLQIPILSSAQSRFSKSFQTYNDLQHKSPKWVHLSWRVFDHMPRRSSAHQSTLSTTTASQFAGTVLWETTNPITAGASIAEYRCNRDAGSSCLGKLCWPSV